MHLPTGIARKIYLIITIVITIPLLLFSCLDALKLRDLLVEKRTQKVLEFASLLEDKLDNNSFEKILAAKNAAKLTKKEQVQILNQKLQPFVAEIASRYPGYGVGFYCRKLDCIVAVGPNFNPNLLGKPASNQPKLKLYQTGKMQVGYIQNGFTWGGGTPILALNYPIYRDGQLIGHAWANTKIADINREFYIALLERFLLTLLVWWICLAIIWQLFKRLETALANLACQIKNEDDQVTAFQEFPKLLPVLNTVVNLREKLKRESNILRWMLEKIPGGFLILNNQEEFVLANQSAYRLLNLDEKRNNFLGTNLDYLVKVLDFKSKTDAPFFHVLHQKKSFIRKNSI